MSGELIKLLEADIPVESLVAKLEAQPERWRENTWRQDYVVKLERPISPQQDTEAVMFRWAPENTIESVRDSLKVTMNKNVIEIPEILPALTSCMNACGATELGRAFVAKLKVGGNVIPHMDFGMYADHFERFHLVLQSDPGNEFFVQDSMGHRESAYMKPGEFFWFNHKETHWAVNNSSRPRMHLIIDMVAPKYRRERAAVPA
jgi:hypothetical protein